jgi:hypothetical protein
MKISYNVKGTERKELVNAIGEIMGIAPVYAGAGGNVIDGERHRFSYVIMNITVTQNGEVLWDGRTDGETINKVFDGLAERGYTADRTAIETESEDAVAGTEEYDAPASETEDAPAFESLQLTEREELGLGQERRDHPGEDGMQASDVPESYTYQAELSDPDCPDRMEVFGAESDEDALRQAYEFCEGEVVLLELFELDGDYNTTRSVEITPRTDRLTIEVPLDGFTPEKLDNLAKLVNAKAPLLMAALGADKLPIKQTAETLLFPWFSGNLDAEHTEAYATLVSLLCKTAIEKKRVTAKEREVDDNPKYAMRCWLLSLGFIGEEYKTARKILLANLSGNSSFKSGERRKPDEAAPAADTEGEGIGAETAPTEDMAADSAATGVEAAV